MKVANVACLAVLGSGLDSESAVKSSTMDETRGNAIRGTDNEWYIIENQPIRQSSD